MNEIINNKKNNFLIPDCTIVTACFNCNNFHNKALNIDLIAERSKIVMETPCYLIIYCDKDTYPILYEGRAKNNLLELTQFKIENMLDLFSFKYLDIVESNRKIYHPTKDERTNSHTHLVTCNKFDFVLRAIEENHFKTSKISWIDCFLYDKHDNKCKISRKYHKSLISYVLNNISEKFHIQILNVNDKKYKHETNKEEYYSSYKYVVCGSFFTCGNEIGKKILERLNDIFVKTTVQGYGHGEEMFYLEVLDEFYDDIIRSYGDYSEILDNFIQTRENFHYISHLIVDRYLNYGYHKEGYDCCVRLIKDIQNQYTFVDYEIFMKLIFKLYIFTFYYKNNEAKEVVHFIHRICENNPYMNNEYEKNKIFYEEQFRYAM